MENKGEFVDQGNVEVALGIFDDFCGFSDANAAGAEDACGDRCAVQAGDQIQSRGVTAADDFADFIDGVFFVPGVDALGAVAVGKINSGFGATFIFNNGNADFFGRAGIHRAFEDDDGAWAQILSDGGAGADQCGEIWALGLVDRSRNGDDDNAALTKSGGVGGEGHAAGSNGSVVEFTGVIAVEEQLVDTRTIDVEADDVEIFARQTARGRPT